MPIRRRRGWEIDESQATPESVFRNRRRLLIGLGLGGVAAAGAGAAAFWAGSKDGGIAAPNGAVAAPGPGSGEAADPTASLYPAPRNPRYVLDRELTRPDLVTTYNNFYEFGSHKVIWREAQDLELRPWAVAIEGMVERPAVVDFDTLIRAMPLEERLYRLRCVEAWSITVPWTGFPLAALVAYARPLGSAKYLEMQTFQDPEQAPGQRQFWYPWPYTEGLTIEEATNELAFIATGLYGKPLPAQNGAPLRLAVPWKYGFKSVKSIVSFRFTDKRPETFWEKIAPDEYGFWANVNPQVPHPRWSQATEEVLGLRQRVPTQIYNGYGEFVAHLYAGRENEPLFM